MACQGPWLHELERAKRPAHVPTVLSRDEVARLLAAMRGTKWLMASLLYGSGLRLRECLKLRVKDVDFGYRQILMIYTHVTNKGGRGVTSPLDGAAARPRSAP